MNAAERSTEGAPAVSASGTAHTAPPYRALQVTTQVSHPSKSFQARRLLRKPGTPQPCGTRAATKGAGPASNPLPSAPRLRSSPAATHHWPPTAALCAAPGPFTAGELQAPYPSAAPARRGLTFMVPTSRRRGKRPHFRPHFLHTPRNSRESCTTHAPRDRGCPMASDAVTGRGVASRRGQAPALPRTQVWAIVSCPGQAQACHWFLEVPLTREKPFLRNGRRSSTQALRD